MNIELFTICDAATNTQGKLNVLGAFDTIVAPSFPVVHPQCAVALRIRFGQVEQGQHWITLYLVDGMERNVVSPLKGLIDVSVQRSDSSAVANIVLNIQGMRLEFPGEYVVKIVIDDCQEVSIPLFVKQFQHPEHQTAQGLKQN